MSYPDKLIMVDFDGTLTHYPELYSKAGLDKENPQESIKQLIEKYKGYPVKNIVGEIKKNIKYRRDLIENIAKEKGNVYIISDNPFLEYLIPGDLQNMPSYKTVVPELDNGRLTGNCIMRSKRDIIKELLNGHKEVDIYTDGGKSDEEVIDYLRKTDKYIRVFRY